MYFLNYLPMLRFRIIYEDFVFVRRYIGWSFDILFLILVGYVYECLMQDLWYQVPAWICDEPRLPHEKFRFIDCFSEDCSLFKIKPNHCMLNLTWFAIFLSLLACLCLSLSICLSVCSRGVKQEFTGIRKLPKG